MLDYDNKNNKAPWQIYKDKIKKVVIANGVTNIGEYAFYDYYHITSVEIPNSVTSIGGYAFGECSDLTSVTIPNSVTSIGMFAFYCCPALASIEIPNSVTSIEDETFYYCTALTSIKIPTSVTSIGEYVFTGCSSLSSIEIPNSVTSIGTYAFGKCTGLSSVEIPNSVTLIGKKAFYDCNNITSVTIGSSVSRIRLGAFGNCKALTSITFNGSTPPEFESGDVFYNVNASIPVNVPANTLDEYEDALARFGFSNIKLPLISLNDNGKAYTQDSQIEGVDVSYTRDFSKYWEPLYIPFSLKYEDWKDDFEIAYINAVHQYDTNDDGDIDKTVLEFVKIKSGSTYPNTPYIIRAKEKGKKTLYAENVTLYESDVNQIKCSTTAQEFIFTGNYKEVSTMDLMAYYTNKYTMHLGDINYINLITGVGAYRWYMEIKERDSAYGINNNNTAKEISIRVVGEETTGIANIQHTSPNTQTYDLNGRKVYENNLKPGIYVKNGKKFVVK